MKLLIGATIYLLTTQSFAAKGLFPSSTIEVVIPVRWDMTRTYINNDNTATESESFSEDWLMVRLQHLGTYLHSPRAQVRVFNFGAQDDLSKLPSGLVLSELNLAKLLGLVTNETHNPQQIIFPLSSSREPSAISFTSKFNGHVSISLKPTHLQ